ncbi:MAG: TGS domain-containing protein, partial [Planctomycetales bacterium]
MLNVTLPDGSVRNYSNLVTPLDIAGDIGPGLARAVIAAEIDGALVGLDFQLPGEGNVALKLLTKDDPQTLKVLRHSSAHVMARAVMRLFEGVQRAFGPWIDNGFYYDFQLDHKLSEDDFSAIEAEMANIIKLNEPFERLVEPRNQAMEICQDLGQPLKVEHIETGLADQETLSFYRQGEFLDLCRGPHVRSAKLVGKAFKILSVAGAYWKGDNSRQQLQRLYATAFWDKSQLETYLHQL